MRITRKIMGRIFAIIMVVVLASGIMITGNVMSALANEPGIETTHLTEVPAGYTAINTPADLDKVRNNLSGKYILMSDIDLTKYAYTGTGTSATWSVANGWKPIGTSSSAFFKGILDGNGYTINGLWSDGRGNYAGLFGYLSGATVKNLTINLASVGLTGTGSYKGGLCGYAISNTKINNVHVVGAKSGSVISGGTGIYIGGLVGIIKTSTISDSSVTDVNLSGYSHVGGVVGYIVNDNTTITSSYAKRVKVDATDMYAGGFAGLIVDSKNVVMQCSVYDSVVKSKSKYAGGFIGRAEGNNILTMCYVDGTNVSGPSYVGGFVGMATGYMKISICCAQNGTATATNNIVGGFIGRFEGMGASINNCYAQMDVAASKGIAGAFIGEYGADGTGKVIGNTYGAGNVTVGAGSYYGAYVGIAYASHTYYSGTNYYDKDLNPQLSGGGSGFGYGPAASFPQGRTTVAMKQESNFVGWDFDTIWTIEEGKTYPYFLFRATGDYKPSAPPTVNDIYAGDKNITGEGVPGAKITVTFPGGETAEATVSAGGTWSVDVPAGVELKAGDVITVVQTESGKDASPPVTVVVLEKKINQSEKPIVDEVNAGDDKITGKGVPGAEITVTFPGDSEGKATVDNDGTWSVDVPSGVELEEGDTIVVVQQEDGKNPSEEVIVTIPIKEDSSAPYVDPVTEGDKKITGDGVPGAEITVTFPDDSEGKTLVDKYGNWSVDVPSGVVLKKDDEISVVQQEDGKKPSIPEIVIVGAKDKSSSPTINYVYENSTVVTGAGIPGSKITVTFPGGITVDTTVKPDYTWSVSIPGTVTLQAGNTVTAQQTEPGKGGSEPVSTIVRPDPASTKRYVYVTQSAPDDDIAYREGELVDVTVTVYNGSTDAWNNVIMLCILPGGVEVMSVELQGIPLTSYNYNPTAGRLTVTNLNLAGKESKDIHITITIKGSGIDTKFIATALAY